MRVRSKPNREGEAPAEPDIDACDLPDGWTAAALGQITRDISYGYTAKATDNDVGPRLLRITDIQDNAVNWNTVPFCEIDDHRVESYRLSPGDLVFARTGATTGKSFLIKTCPDSVFASYLIRVRPSAALLPEYVAAFFQTRDYWSQITENLSGSAQPNCNASKLASLVVPIAPLAEQRRIVGKLELLLGKVSSSQQRLSRVPGLLKRFRQSVLAAACSGKLTADWREQNDCVEPALDLIARLGSERRDRHRELCAAAKNTKRAKPQEFDNVEPSVRTDLDTFDLPADWSWVDLRFVMTVDEPFCYGVVQPGANEPSGILLVRAGDLQNGTVNISELRRIPAAIDAEYERSRLRGGELLITVVGAGIGTVAIAPASCAGFNIARAVAKVPIRDVSANYVFHWLSTNTALSWMVGDAREVARPTLNLEQLRTILVPLPPLSEQQEIVRRVEKLFAFADQIEARLKQAQAHVERLTQSLLAKAFRGELVPTEHALATRDGRDYEPASELLDRIRTAQTGDTPATTPRRRKASSSR